MLGGLGALLRAVATSILASISWLWRRRIRKEEHDALAVQAERMAVEKAKAAVAAARAATEVQQQDESTFRLGSKAERLQRLQDAMKHRGKF